jgi:O-antigen/teichoic acid export membrane protein
MKSSLRSTAGAAIESNDPGSSAPAAVPDETGPAKDGTDAAWLAWNSVVVIAGSFAGQGLQFGCQMILARLLGPAEFGLYGIGWTLLRLAGPFATLGLNTGVIYAATRVDQSHTGSRRDVLLQSLGLGFLAGGVIGVVAYIAAPGLSADTFAKGELTGVIRSFALTLPLLTGLAVASAATKLSMSMVYATCTEAFTQPAVNLVLVAIGLYFLHWRLMGAIAATVISYAVALLLALYFMFRLFWPTLRSRNKMRSYVGGLLAFSVPASIAASFTNLIVRVDRLMVGAFLPATEVGIYQAASQASVVFGFIPAIFNSVIASRVSDLHARAEIERLGELYKLGAKWSFYLAMPLFLVVCSTPGGVMEILYGVPYLRGAWPLLILCAGLMSDVVIGAGPTVLIFSGNQKLMGVISASALISTIILNYLLVPRIGMIGGAVSACIPEVGMMFAFLMSVKSCVGVWPHDRRWFKGIVATACSAAALWLLHGWMAGFGQFAPFPNLIVAEGVFWAVLFLAGLDPEDKELFATNRGRARESKDSVQD